MTTRVDVEEIETTRSEKVLAAVLAGFVLMSLLWVYFHVDAEHDHPFRDPASSLAAADRAALARADRADARLRSATRRQSDRRATLVDRREAYRTALDEGRQDPALRRRYAAAQAAYADAQAQTRAAGRERAAAQPAARSAQQRLDAATERAEQRIDDANRHDGRVSFARRFALVLAALGGAYWLLARLRRRRSRYLPAALAAVVAAALLALIMAIDYLTDYVELTDLGVLILAVAGILMTLAALAVLQRHLARRIPERRVRRRECPFCGYPSGENPHCEGCGRDVIAECATCSAPRRVGTRHCRACGTV
jgi:hypothetical protein